jgi:transposase
VIQLGEVVMIPDLHRQGLTVSAIARELGFDRKTVRKCIKRGLEAPVYDPRKPRQRLIDPFVPYLRERVTAYPGLTGRRLFRELRELYRHDRYAARDSSGPIACFRGPLRDAARRAGAGRLCPIPAAVHG